MVMDHSTKETALEIGGWYDLPNNFTGVANYYEAYHWYLNSKRHRDDGPAIEYAGGDKYWYLNGKEYPKEEWFELLTSEQQIKFLWNL